MVAVTRALSLGSVRSPVLLLFSLLAAVVLAPAQDSAVDFEGRIIGRIEFEPPNQPYPRSEMEQLLPFKVGSPLHRAEIRTALEKLYHTGRFSDISVDAELDNGIVVLRIATEFQYFVSGVAINGVPDPPSKGQLDTAAKLGLGIPFADHDLKQASDNIMDRLRANGLYQATIKTSVQRIPETEEVNLQFDVTPGTRARFDGVQLSGDYNGPPERMVRETRWRRGLGSLTFPGWRQLTEKRAQTGVNRVLQYLQRGDHFEAKVTLSDVNYHADTNTVTPSLDIMSGPSLQVHVEGAKISNGRLRQLIPVFQEHTVDRSLLLEGQRNLVDYFQSQGYFSPDVDFNQETDGDVQVIDYRVALNIRQKLASIKIEGNRFFDTDTLREHLDMAPAKFLRYRFGRYSQKLLDQDLNAVRDLYRSNGFRGVDVTAKIDDNYKGQAGHLAVSIQVKEGPQSLVSKLELQGVGDAEAAYVRSLLQSTENQPFSEVNVAADRDSLLSYYYNNGYPDATFDWTQTPGPTPNTLNLVYVIRAGKHEFVRTVLIRGLNVTKPSLITKRIMLEPGEAISQSRIAQSQQKLYDLGIFSKVETAIQNPDGDEDNKYVLVRVDEAGRYSLSTGIGAQLGRIGGGVTTFDQPAGTTGFSPRVSLGISRLNFLGLAHTVSLQTRISTIDKRAVLSYLIPQLMGNENLSFTMSGLFDDSQDIRTFAARRWEGSVQLAQRISRVYSMQYRITFRRVDISNLAISAKLIPNLSQPERAGVISMTFIQDRRDDPVNSHRGIYNTIDVGMALRQLGSQTIFSRLLMRNSTYHPIGRNIVIARTLQFGYIQRLFGEPEIPLAERFYAGGASSDRAFPDNQAGPRDTTTGFPIGGNALLFHSTELRFPLIGDNVGGVLFHDMGNVYREVRDINLRFRQHHLQDFDYTVQSVGFGVRYRTPIGPLRADFSVSPNAPRFYGFKGTLDQLIACGEACPVVAQKINAFQFHFSLGQTF